MNPAVSSQELTGDYARRRERASQTQLRRGEAAAELGVAATCRPVTVRRGTVTPKHRELPRASSDELAQATAPLHAVSIASALLLPMVVLGGFLAVLVVRTSGHSTAVGGLTFLSGVPRTYLLPEPGEQHAYLMLLLAPLLLSSGLIALHRAGCLMHSRWAKVLLLPAGAAGQALILFLIAISLHRQQDLHPYFRNWQLVVAAVTALMVAAAVAVPRTLALFRLS